MVDTERWLSREEAATMLGVHVRTLDRLVREKVLARHHIQSTRIPRFRIEDVRALIVPNGSAK
jgi:excisionase family DNA binding protein